MLAVPLIEQRNDVRLTNIRTVQSTCGRIYYSRRNTIFYVIYQFIGVKVATFYPPLFRQHKSIINYEDLGRCRQCCEILMKISG